MLGLLVTGMVAGGFFGFGTGGIKSWVTAVVLPSTNCKKSRADCGRSQRFLNPLRRFSSLFLQETLSCSHSLRSEIIDNF
jgi:hypothetical protein